LHQFFLHIINLLFDQILLHEKLDDTVRLATAHELLDLALKGVHHTSQLVFFLKHLFSLLIEVLVIHLEQLFNFILMADKTIVDVSSLREEDVFELCQVRLNLLRHLSDADVVMALVILGTQTAEEFIRNLAIELDWTISMLLAHVMPLGLQTECFIDVAEVMGSFSKAFWLKLLNLWSLNVL
jgi:hypothetical protein